MQREQILTRNRAAILEFRDSAGRLEAFGDAPVLLLTTVGAKSGQHRTSPMMYLPHDTDSDTVYVFASAAGADQDPNWMQNIRAHPAEIAVEIGRHTRSARATELDEPRRSEVFSTQANRYSGFADYQAQTDRIIPVVELHLEPVSPTRSENPSCP